MSHVGQDSPYHPRSIDFRCQGQSYRYRLECRLFTLPQNNRPPTNCRGPNISAGVYRPTRD
jgi:hypothetical protein